MTEQELRETLRSKFSEMQPIVNNMTELLFEVYSKGFNDGLDIGLQLTSKEDDINR